MLAAPVTGAMSHLVCIPGLIRKDHRQSGRLAHLLLGPWCPRASIGRYCCVRGAGPVSEREADDGVP